MSESQDSPFPPIASRNHTIGLLAIIAVLTWGGAYSVAKHGAGHSHHLGIIYLEMMIQEYLILAYVVWGVRRHGGSLGQLVEGRWTRVWDFGRDVLLAFGFWIGSVMCLAPLIWVLRVNQSANPVRFFTPLSRLELALWVFNSMTAGFCEEIIFRGYLQRQFIAWSGKPALGIILSALVFGGGHAYQGARRTILLAVFGALLGILAYARQSLRPGMMAHAWQDALFGVVNRALMLRH